MSEVKSAEEIEKQLEQFKQWLKSQPHLPQDLEERMMRRFLHSCYYDLERAKTAAELFFTLRAAAPELLNDRDPLSPQFQRTLSIVNLTVLKIAGNRNLWIWQLNDPGLEVYDYVQDCKLFFMTTDAWFLHDDEDMGESDIVLLDVKDISLKFLTKFNVSAARKLSKYQEDAMPIRLKQIHIVNAPSFIDKIFGLVKPFLKQDMTDMIHFHPPKSDSLYKYLDKDDLPDDYGGTRGRMEDLSKEVIADLIQKRDILIRNDLWRADKKSKNKNESSTEIGSFRSLAID